MCVIIAPQVWYERLFEGCLDGSLMEFRVLKYFTERRYHTVNFSWEEMWFVAYIMVITVVFYPLVPLPFVLNLSPFADFLAPNKVVSIMTAPGLLPTQVSSALASSSPSHIRR